MSVNTIIFGPTGSVASYIVQYAASHGANVTLAMRDTSKAIPGLSEAQESSGKFNRVQADLTDTKSVTSAASTAQAHSAFIYLVHGYFGIRDTIQALKDGGVKHVVFLSSISVEGDLRSIPQSEYIPWSHAQPEIALEEVYGAGNYTAVRPAWFATNMFRYIGQMKTGVVREICPDNVCDMVAPKDIGDVIGSLLLREDGPLPTVVDVCGPQVLKMSDVLKRVAKASGKEVIVEEIDVEVGVQFMISQGLPEFVARYVGQSAAAQKNGETHTYEGERFEIGQKTVKTLLGREPITADEWIEENKGAFA